MSVVAESRAQALTAAAQIWPTKRIVIVFVSPAGGDSDAMTRGGAET